MTGSWASALAALATSPQGERLVAAAVSAIVDAILAGRGHFPAGPAELDTAAYGAVQAVADRARASGDAFDEAVKEAGGA